MLVLKKKKQNQTNKLRKQHSIFENQAPTRAQTELIKMMADMNTIIHKRITKRMLKRRMGFFEKIKETDILKKEKKLWEDPTN